MREVGGACDELRTERGTAERDKHERPPGLRVSPYVYPSIFYTS